MDFSIIRDKSFEIAQQLLKRDLMTSKEKNTVISPFSVMMLMAMMADASEGKTREEIIRSLCGENNFEVILNSLTRFQENMMDTDTLRSANGVFVQAGLKSELVAGYAQRLEQLFDGKLIASRNLCSDANAWIEEKTNGMIRNAFNESLSESIFSMMNTVCFEAEWKDAYREENIINETFLNSDNTESRVKMLESHECTYFENEMLRGFARPYKKGGFSFVALLPKRENGDIIEEDIDFLDLSRCRKNESASVSVLMPEFFCDSIKDLIPYFKQTGMEEVFSKQADFSRIFKEPVQLSSAIQKAHIEVNHKGTRAAAMSCGNLGAGSIIDIDEIEFQEVVINRPFFYAVIHEETGIPIFIGLIRHMEDISDGEDGLSREERAALCDRIYKEVFDCLYDEEGHFRVSPTSSEFDTYDEFDDRLYTAHHQKDIPKLRKIARDFFAYKEMGTSD